MSESVDLSKVLASGVYILRLRERVAFVGKAKCIVTKLHAHRAQRRGDKVPPWMPAAPVEFDSVEARLCRVDQLEETWAEVCSEVGWQYRVTITDYARQIGQSTLRRRA